MLINPAPEQNDFPPTEEELVSQRLAEEENWHYMMNDMYVYTEDGFCDGFARY